MEVCDSRCFRYFSRSFKTFKTWIKVAKLPCCSTCIHITYSYIFYIYIATKLKPVVSSVVWTRLPDKQHYGLGFVAKKDWRYQIKFANGTITCHNRHDPLALALDRQPKPEELNIGSDVIGRIPEEILMHAGRVKKILENSYEIQFENGEVHENNIDQLRVLKVPRSEGRL